MLGRLRMPVADCLHEYQTLAGNVFGKPNFFNEASWFWVPYLRQSKYDTATLEKTFKDVAKEEYAGLTSQRNREKPGSIDVDVRISSYERHNRWNPRWPIWKVARAATAAPFYFDPVRSEKQDIEYTDGGLGESNNPINIGIDEIKEIAGKNGIGIAVSVGTARGETRTRSRIKRKLKEIIGRASDPEKVHKSAEETIPHYYRINRPDQLRLELDDWRPRGPLIPSAKSGSRTLEEIKNSFYSWYGSSDGVQEMFQKCAEELVERRKARAEDKAKWEHFATGMQFKCPGKDCNTRPADIDRDEFVMHINHEHQDDDFDQKEDQATIIKNSSSSWQYQEFQSGRS
ncbi:MAG: hypothetical protein M1821_001758 [Bathelium mastoideum]|nr:MAG: hypothetical protein M1821_001758 [Bathelium mastoideum]